jgi:hypothetical protein
MLPSRLPKFIAQNYECHEWKHASAILSQDFPGEWQDLLDLLAGFRLRRRGSSRAAVARGVRCRCSGSGNRSMSRMKHDNRSR